MVPGSKTLNAWNCGWPTSSAIERVAGPPNTRAIALA